MSGSEDQKVWITFLSESTKRSIIFYSFAFGPAAYYFHKKRKIFLGSKFLRHQQSYYNPEMSALGKDS